MQKSLLFTIFLLTFSIASCIAQRGSGNIVEKEVSISGVKGVHLSGSGTVEITIGKTEVLIIRGDDNIIERLDIDVHKGILELGQYKGSNWNMSPTQSIEYYVTVTDLEELCVSGSGEMKVKDKITAGDFEMHISGSGELYVSDLRAKDLEVSISGSGECTVSGGVDKQNIHISGSGEYKAKDLESNEAECHVSGSGEMEIRVAELLDASVSGSGDIDYWGRPRIKFDGSGSGDLNNRGD